MLQYNYKKRTVLEKKKNLEKTFWKKNVEKKIVEKNISK